MHVIKANIEFTELVIFIYFFLKIYKQNKLFIGQYTHIWQWVRGFGLSDGCTSQMTIN